MDFDALLAQVRQLLQRQGRVSYRALKLRFQLDDEALAALTDELIYAERVAVDEDGRVLVWTGPPTPASATPSVSTAPPEREPRAYTPPYLAEKILTSRSALEGERKQVTVLFADLKGSMELLAERDPEEARAILDPVLERMMAAVHRYEGTVNQVMGDGIMALFGAPIAHEDHAVRACYAALRMQETVTHYGDEMQRSHGVPVQIRVGLNSGAVVVRAIDSSLHMDYSAIGQTTHLAARMEQLALPGSIRLTADTLRLVEGYVEVTPLGPVPVKGLPEPIEIYELLRAGPVRTRLQASAARGLTRFVGRDAELDQLRQALDRAGRGHGQVVAVIGEPGVGKSRLYWEFMHSHRTHGWFLLSSHSVSYGKATAYLPVIDLLKAYCGVETRDDTRRVREQVTGKLLTLDRDLEPTLPAILARLEVPLEDAAWQALDPPQRRQRTLEAVKRLLLRESQRQPLLLVFEDLQWIDAETQALLDSLLESLPSACILLLVNYRPEYQHGWGPKTYYSQVRLDPLPPASADELLHALLGEDPSLAPLKTLLIERTEGNPFFLEESARTVIETQGLVGEPGGYRLATSIQTLQIPATVQAVLAARIDRLPSEDKRLLQTAAVIGTEVSLPLLEAIAELPESLLHRGLAHLQAAEFLYETRLFPEYAYTFKHALTHEVAYGSLLLERRRALHARIVEASERLYADRLPEQAERLAQHALRGEVWDKAGAYGRQAGEKALARSAYREAVGYFEQALSAHAHLPETRATHEQAIDLRCELRNALHPLNEQARLLDHLREAEVLAERLGDNQRLGRIANYLCISFSNMGEHDRAIAAGQRALALATASGAFDIQVVAQTHLSAAYYRVGDYRQGLDVSRQAIVLLTGEWRLARFGEVAPPAVSSRGIMAWSLAELGGFVEGHSVGEEAIQLAEAFEQPYSITFALSSVGLLSRRQGALHMAIPVLERGLALCQTANIGHLFPQTASILGTAYVLAGRIADTLPLLDQTLECVAIGSRMMNLVLVLTELSEALLLVGRVDEASVLAERLREISRTHTGRGYQAHALRLLAEEIGMRPLQAHCHLGLGTIYAKAGQRQVAQAELSAAIDLYRAMAMTFWLPQAEAALAQVEAR
jgi:class 3 adenylate cyclase/tetratricopeptide (TPR) repeat protein